MRIDKFKGEFEFLSNFFPVEIEMDGLLYPSVEHAYQAAKTLSPSDREAIRMAKSAAVAKRLGKTLVLRPKWNDVRVKIMHSLLLKKFAHEGLAKRLLATDGMEIVEGNTWGDTFWGVCNGVGDNTLGQLLELVREQIR
jgi:ribA/ribD-fused uncharacterized protein